MIDDIEQILGTILATDGITGAMVLDAEGALLGARMPAVYTADMLSEVGDQVVAAILTLAEMKMRADDLTYRYDEQRLVVRALQRKGYLCILSQPNLGTALLNITTNVAQKKLQKVLDGKPTATRVLRRATPALVVEAPPPTLPPPPPTLPPVPPPPAPVAATPPPGTDGPPPSGGQRPSGGAKVASEGAAAPTATGSAKPFTAAGFIPEPDMGAAAVVFNVLLGELLAATGAASAASQGEFLEAVLAAGAQLRLPVPATEALRQWCRSSGMEKMHHVPAPKEMGRLLHQLYIFLCEYHGPILGDRILKLAIRNTDSLPAAREFAVKSLL